MEETRWNLFRERVWGVSISSSLSFPILTISIQPAISTKYACSKKLNKSQLRGVKNSALGRPFLPSRGHPSLNFSTSRRFESWNPASDVNPGTPEYYKKQVYKQGTRCWNGPERNTVVGPLSVLLQIT